MLSREQRGEHWTSSGVIQGTKGEHWTSFGVIQGTKDETLDISWCYPGNNGRTIQNISWCYQTNKVEGEDWTSAGTIKETKQCAWFPLKQISMEAK